MTLHAGEAELNEPQAEAVAHVDGPLLVFAGAGSGKTRVITFRIANLVATHRVPPYRILAVTFTNKAAGEMRERLRHLLGDDVARDLWVGTFHATCARLLRRHHAAVGLGRDFVIYDDADQKSLVNRIVKDLEIDDKRYPPRSLLAQIHAHKQEGRAPEEVNVASYLDEVAVKVFSAYEAHLRASNACDFDDLLLHVLRLVERPDPDLGDELQFPPPEVDLADEAGAAIRRQFRYVLVDEFQDTNAVQYRLVRAMVRAHGNLAVVGDDDQSIYSWRGADVRNIRNFSRDFPQATVVRLEQNYRSTERIVRAALGVIAPSPNRVPKDLWTANEEGESVLVRAASDEREEASQVVSSVRAWCDEGWTRNEIAVLYRTHAQSRVLEEALRAARLPYRIVGGLRFFDRAEIKDLLSYLRLTVNPKSDVDLLRVVNVPTRGVGDTTVDRVQAAAQASKLSMLDAVRTVAAGTLEANVAAAARKKLGAFVAIVDELRQKQGELAPSELAAFALERTGYVAALEAEATTEATTRLQNLAELVGSIRDYEETARAQGETPTLVGFLEKTALVTTADQVKSDDAVTLMTVHAAKGLEYRGVLIVGLEDELFPSKGFRARDDDVDGEEAENLEEERRLAYVAITRARQRLVLTYAAQRTLYGQTRPGRPSRFLRDLPPEVVKMLGGRSTATVPRGWGASVSAARFGEPRGAEPWRHPMSGLVSAPGSAPLPGARRAVERAPGERYVEREVEEHHGDDELRRGTRVRHKKFGEGSVLELVAGPEPKIVADFPGWGRMTILRRFVEVVD
ncbi:MAG: UvrD-helicase domain-containing protein [Deltaproteobacteria bacterium]|nr:UvrD-helicase domain-containing protein [Deltaproteobacteria bacterium]